MLAKVQSVALVGLDAHLIDVEVDIAGGLPQFSVVGLPDATVRESRDRVRSALKNTGFHFPAKKITVNLAPADIKKEGAGLDLAIAIGILVAEEVIPSDSLDRRVLVGELWLDGQIKPVSGALSIGLACRREYSLLLPAENAMKPPWSTVSQPTASIRCRRPWHFFEANASSNRCRPIASASLLQGRRKKTTMAMSEDKIRPSGHWRSPQRAGTMS